MADLSLNITATTASAQQSVESLAQSIRELTAGVKRSTKEIGKMGEGTRTASAHLLSLGRSAHKTAGFFEKFGKSLGRIAFYRAIRSAIRYVTSAFKEGLEAAYNWSKLHPEHAKLAGSMDRLREAAGKMKLQLGAAFGGLIVAIEPILIKIINLVTAAANAITQFFAILNGTGWYKKAVSGLTETANAAGGAGNKIKGLLASWDELTVIGKETGGGGGSGTNDGDGGYVWEQVDSEISDLINNGKFFELGANLAEQLNLGIQSWDAEGTARWISEKLGNLLDFANGFIINFDFVALGEKLYEFVTNVEWDELASKLYEGLGAAFGGIGQFLFGIVKSGVQDAFDSFMSASFDGNGDFNFSGFWEWLTNAIKKGAKLTNPLLLIWEDIIPDFVSGFISSVTNGEENSESVSNAIEAWFDSNIATPIYNCLSDPFINQVVLRVLRFKVSFLEAWNGFLESIDNPFTAWILDGFGVDFPNAVNNSKQALEDAQTELSNFESKLGDSKTTADDLGGTLSGVANDIKTLSSSWNGIDSGKKKLSLEASTSGNDKSGKSMNNIVGAWIGLSGKTNADGVGNISLGVTNNIPAGLDGDIKNVNSSWATLSKTGKKTVTLDAKQTGVKPNVLQTIITLWDNLIGGEKEIHVSGDVEDGLKDKIKDIGSTWGGLPTGNGLKKIFTANLNGSAKPKDISALGSGWDKIGTKSATLTAIFNGDGFDKNEFKDIKGKWGELGDKKPEFKPSLDISRPVSNWVDKWNDLRDKKLELKAVLTDTVRNAWNTVARAWNNTPLLRELGTLPTFAQGGFPEEGQLFIAREAGPELVGSMNGKTAVANNDQIVAGITSGVKAAQSEQNALLKQQNAILIELLKKEFVLSPSVGLGQVVSRSATLYGRAN